MYEPPAPMFEQIEIDPGVDPSGCIVWRAPDGEHPARAASRRSYGAAGAKDRERWLACYAEDAVVRDPVGPSWFDDAGTGHRGRRAIGDFYDKAIGPVERFQFLVRDSHANGDTCCNVGTITTWFADGTRVDTDLAMVYVVNEDGSIASMSAHWEPDRAMGTATKE